MSQGNRVLSYAILLCSSQVSVPSELKSSLVEPPVCIPCNSLLTVEHYTHQLRRF